MVFSKCMKRKKGGINFRDYKHHHDLCEIPSILILVYFDHNSYSYKCSLYYKNSKQKAWKPQQDRF